MWGDCWFWRLVLIWLSQVRWELLLSLQLCNLIFWIRLVHECVSVHTSKNICHIYQAVCIPLEHTSESPAIKFYVLISFCLYFLYFPSHSFDSGWVYAAWSFTGIGSVSWCMPFVSFIGRKNEGKPYNGSCLQLYNFISWIRLVHECISIHTSKVPTTFIKDCPYMYQTSL